MSNILANSYISTGAATAISKGMSPERFAERSGAYALKEKRDQELRTLKATEPTDADRQTMSDVNTVALQNALSQQQQLLRDNNRKLTFNAYERYDNSGGDVRHLNQMFSDLSESGSKMYGDIARVDKLTEADIELMDQTGISTKDQKRILSDPDSAASYVKITQTDGSTSFGDVDALKGVTGYNDYASNKELERQKTQREIEMLTAIGYDTTPVARDAFRRTVSDLPNVDYKTPEFQELYSKYLDEGTARKRSLKGINDRYGGKYSTSEAYAARVVEDMGLQQGDPEFNDAFNEALREYNDQFKRPSATRNIENAESARQELEDAGFWDMDFANMSSRERSKIEPKIRRIEQLAGSELTQADKTQLVRIKELTDLGDAVNKLTPTQVGLMDRIWRKTKAYIFDDVEGIEAETAYAAFRNVTRYALYGSALTPTETKAFKEAFGSLFQQRGAVLAKFKVSIDQLKSNYESILELNDPMVIAYRTGKTEADLEDVIYELDQRIRFIDDVMNDRPTTVTTPLTGTKRTILTEEDEIGLDNIFEDKQ